MDQVHGSNPKLDIELFFSDWNVQQGYRQYVSNILNRQNTITGIAYKNDPVIFSIELMNEPHTTCAQPCQMLTSPGGVFRAHTSAYFIGQQA